MTRDAPTPRVARAGDEIGVDVGFDRRDDRGTGLARRRERRRRRRAADR